MPSLLRDRETAKAEKGASPHDPLGERSFDILAEQKFPVAVVELKTLGTTTGEVDYTGEVE